MPSQRPVVVRTVAALGTRSHAPGRTRRRAPLLAAASAGAAWVSGPAGAQKAWPARPIRLICGQPPGGLTDQCARAYGDALSRAVGQPVVIDNRPGASGTIADFIAHARARGGTTGSYSPASLPHMISDQWNRQHNPKLQTVHYKGESPMWVDVSPAPQWIAMAERTGVNFD